MTWVAHLHYVERWHDLPPIDIGPRPGGNHSKRLVNWIIADVAQKHKVRPADIVRRIRTRRLSAARHEAIARIVAETSWPYTHIARHFNYLNGDISTVLLAATKYGVRRAHPARNPDPPALR